MKNLSDAPLLGRLLALPTDKYTRLEKHAKDKRSSLLRKFVTYGSKKFYNIGTRGLHHKLITVVINTFCNKLLRLSPASVSSLV